jgi:ABC-type bacteriocin/lantibiotic exporter with double-glycine peptidase domain
MGLNGGLLRMKIKILAFIAFYLLLLNGCATAPMQTPNIKNPSAMLPERVIIEGIKIERGQSFTDCVPVALEAIFKFYGKKISRKEIDERVHKSWGTKTRDWIEYVKEQGFNVYAFYDRSRDKRGLKFLLAQHFPVLAIGGGLSWQSHIVILVGYDDEKKNFYIADPGWRVIQQQRYLEFNEWHRLQNGYGFVIYPPTRSIEKL